MITKLKLFNIGGVHEAEINLAEGLNVITGESGAGKSSVVSALELLSGRRGNAQVIKSGESQGEAEADFVTSLNFDDELDEDLRPINLKLNLKRVILNSRSYSSLQGVRVPLNIYSIAASRLIHIQSQFAQLELLDSNKQLEMIDARLDNNIKLNLINAFDAASAKAQELKDLKKRRAEIESKYANAEQVLNLVKTARPEAGLELKLENNLREISNKLAARKKLINNLDKLFGGMSEQGLLSELRNIFDSLNNEDVNNALSVLEDAAENLRGSIINEDEYLAEQEETENRLGVLRKLKRLSGSHNESELINYCDNAVINLEWLENSFNELENLSKQALNLKREANALALSLREERKREALNLEQSVNNILKDLAMADSEFKVNFKELNKLKRTGADEIEFILTSSSRTGRIDKIASGGELSRILLALQLSLPDRFLPDTLVFDEIEAGLGGKAAVLSGLKLKELSKRCQVILVTHEASIAALGDAHINITRDNLDNDAVTIKNISGEDRVKELARMLSGSPDLIEAQEHARRLLKV